MICEVCNAPGAQDVRLGSVLSAALCHRCRRAADRWLATHPLYVEGGMAAAETSAHIQAGRSEMARDSVNHLYALNAGLTEDIIVWLGDRKAAYPPIAGEDA